MLGMLPKPASRRRFDAGFRRFSGIAGLAAVVGLCCYLQLQRAILIVAAFLFVRDVVDLFRSYARINGLREFAAFVKKWRGRLEHSRRTMSDRTMTPKSLSAYHLILFFILQTPNYWIQCFRAALCAFLIRFWSLDTSDRHVVDFLINSPFLLYATITSQEDDDGRGGRQLRLRYSAADFALPTVPFRFGHDLLVECTIKLPPGAVLAPRQYRRPSFSGVSGLAAAGAGTPRRPPSPSLSSSSSSSSSSIEDGGLDVPSRPATPQQRRPSFSGSLPGIPANAPLPTPTLPPLGGPSPASGGLGTTFSSGSEPAFEWEQACPFMSWRGFFGWLREGCPRRQSPLASSSDPTEAVYVVDRFELNGHRITSSKSQLMMCMHMFSAVVHPLVHTFFDVLYHNRHTYEPDKVAEYNDIFLHGQYLNYASWRMPGVFWGHKMWSQRALIYNSKRPVPVHSLSSFQALNGVQRGRPRADSAWVSPDALAASSGLRTISPYADFLATARPIVFRLIAKYKVPADPELFFLTSVVHSVDHYCVSMRLMWHRLEASPADLIKPSVASPSWPTSRAGTVDTDPAPQGAQGKVVTPNLGPVSDSSDFDVDCESTVRSAASAAPQQTSMWPNAFNVLFNSPVDMWTSNLLVYKRHATPFYTELYDRLADINTELANVVTLSISS